MLRFNKLRGSRRALAALAAVVSLGTLAVAATPAAAGPPLVGPTPVPTNATSITFLTPHDGLVNGQSINFHVDTTSPATLNKVHAKICATGFTSYGTTTFGYANAGGTRCVYQPGITAGGLPTSGPSAVPPTPLSAFQLGPVPYSAVTTSGTVSFTAGTGSVAWTNSNGNAGNGGNPLLCDKTHNCDLVVDVGLTGDSVTDTFFIQPLTYAGTPAAPVPTIGGGDVSSGQVTVHWTTLGAGLPSGNGTIDKYTVTAVPHTPSVGTCPASGPAPVNVTTGFALPSTPVSATQAVVSGLADACQYDFTITAENVASDGATHFTSSAGGPVSATPTTAGPTLSGSPADSAVDLSWLAVPGATSYRVTSNPGPCPAPAGCTFPGTTAHISGLTNGTAYTFTVAAQIGAGGPFTAESNAVILTPNGSLITQTIQVVRPQGTLVISQYCSGLPTDLLGNFDPSNNNGNDVPNPVPATNCNLTLSGPRSNHIQSNAITAEPRSVLDAVTSGGTTITSATIGFTANDLDQLVTGDGIPAGTRIAGVTNATTATLTNPATVSLDGGTFTIVGTTVHFGAVAGLGITPDGSSALAAGNVGHEIEGLQIPGGSTISAVLNPSTFDISQPADAASNAFTTREWLQTPTPAHLITSGPHRGQYFQATGQLRQVTVVDTRPADTGWTATGQVTNFSDGSHSFSGDNLGWTPKNVHAFSSAFTSPDGSYSMAPAKGAAVTAGSVPGLHSGSSSSTDSSVAGPIPGQTLAYAISPHGLGLAKLDADFLLWIPVQDQAGHYSAVLTLTAV